MFIVETGGGTPGATSYVTVAFITAYLTDRNREAENLWSTQLAARQQEAAVVATSYIDNRFGPLVKGTRLRTLIPGRVASGTLELTVLPTINQTVTVGQMVYRLVDALALENDVLRGATIVETAANLMAAIGGGDGVNVHLSTRPNYEVAAGLDTDDNLIVAATNYGTSGNSVVFSTNVTGATATGAGFLSGGVDEGPQPLIFPRRGLRGYGGEIIVGIPLPLKQATAEYAVRSLAAALDPDPTFDATGSRVQRKREKVGPIEEETEYAQGATLQIYRSYPAADRLLQEYLQTGGRVFR